MGIDIYLRWDDMPESEVEKQYTGFSIAHGHVGYLREAYHGGPYATHHLVPEAFEAEECVAAIPASVMRDRLSEVLQIAKQRSERVYEETLSDDDPALKSFVDFVELAERKEKETGFVCRVVASY